MLLKKISMPREKNLKLPPNLNCAPIKLLIDLISDSASDT